MNTFLGHLALHSIGLLMAAIAVFGARFIWRRHPISCYRVLVAALGAALVLPLAQLAVEGKAAGHAPFAWKPFEEEASVRPLREQTPLLLAVLPNTMSEGVVATPVANLAVEALESVLGRPSNLPRDINIPWVPIALVFWIAGALLSGRHLLWRAFVTWSLLRRAEVVTHPGILSVLARVLASSKVKGQVRLLASTEVHSPSCLGFFKSVIVIPADQATDAAALRHLECALHHEIVHLERSDTTVAMLQAVLTSLLWFHPAVWWLSHELNLFRELSCDEEVVRRTGDRHRYAEALLCHAEHLSRQPRRAPLPCPTLVGYSRSRTQLRRRIEMLIRNCSSDPKARGASAYGIAALLAALWGTQLAAAATLFPGPQEEPPQERVAAIDTAPVQDSDQKLGVVLGTVPEALAAHLGREASGMLLIEKVSEDSIADRCGVKAFDVVISVDGEEPASEARVQAARRRVFKGEGVPMLVLRAGQKIEIVLSREPGKTSRRRATERVLEENPFGHRHAADSMNRQAIDQLKMAELEAMRARERDVEEAVRANREAVDAMRRAQEEALRFNDQLQVETAKKRGEYEEALRRLQSNPLANADELRRLTEQARAEYERNAAKVREEIARNNAQMNEEIVRNSARMADEIARNADRMKNEIQRNQARSRDAAARAADVARRRAEERAAKNRSDQTNSPAAGQGHSRFENHLGRTFKEHRAGDAFDVTPGQTGQGSSSSVQEEPKPTVDTNLTNQEPSAGNLEADLKRIAELKRQIAETQKELERLRRSTRGDRKPAPAAPRYRSTGSGGASNSGRGSAMAPVSEPAESDPFREPSEPPVPAIAPNSHGQAGGSAGESGPGAFGQRGVRLPSKAKAPKFPGQGAASLPPLATVIEAPIAAPKGPSSLSAPVSVTTPLECEVVVPAAPTAAPEAKALTPLPPIAISPNNGR